MSADAITQLSLTDLVAKIKAKELKPSEATSAYFTRIEKLDGRIGAFLALDVPGASTAAHHLDQKQAKGEDLGPLGGAPIAIKDIFVTRGVETTAASRILRGYRPPYDATAVAKLKAAGAVVLGKANCDEFAMGSSNENSAYKKVLNPWDLERTPGGSSGGSAAAVAADLSAASIGTDTGGSIRQPASLTSTVGVKPTYGRVSRYGMIAFASSLDQGGPFGKTVRDAARMLECMSGHDAHDSTSVSKPVPAFEKAAERGLAGDVKGMRIAVPKEYFGKGLDPVVEKVTRDAIESLKNQGAQIVDVSLPYTEYAVATYYLVATAECSSNLARFDGVRYGMRVEGKDLVEMYSKTRNAGFGAEVKRRILLGTYVLSAGYYDAYYRKAMQVRTLIRGAFNDVLAKADAILGPVAPTPAFRIGEKVSDPLAMYLSDIYTIAVNLAGLPGISVPAGFAAGAKPLPIGVQLVAKAWDEESLFRAAGAIETASGVVGKKPVLA
ncbi:MAG TPA: Asp-tRNA(Asn)/Glu-tRNA(Gln) amidotransferase subunit GatA [bacterium]|nr:Asp-tRNA(Asn)/Glu-tRNA(Gln) amidotransferase subunit GatA [bacterium]